MQLTLPLDELKELVGRQLANLFVFQVSERKALSEAIDLALEKCEVSFSAIGHHKYYRKDGRVRFDPFHSAQNTQFLYWVSHLLWKHVGEANLASRVYYLNKALNGLDLYYEVEMPDIWTCDHPVGTVIGRARFGNYFSFGQNCTVGNNLGVYPQFGERVALLSGSKVIGACCIGEDSIIASNTCCIDQTTPPSSLVYGQFPHIKCKPLPKDSPARVYLNWRSDDLDE